MVTRVFQRRIRIRNGRWQNEQKDLRIEFQKTEADLEEQIEELGRGIDAVTGRYIK